MTNAAPLIHELAPHAQVGFHTLQDGKKMRYAIVGEGDTAVWIAPGRREFIEKKYLEVGSELLKRNLKLIFCEFFNQGLSTHLLGGDMHQRDHIDSFERHLAAAHSFYNGIVKPNSKNTLLHAHSMGAHVLMRWLMTQNETTVRGAFFSAPMLAIIFGQYAQPPFGALAWGLGKLGLGEHYGPGQHDFNFIDKEFIANPLTHDAARFAIIRDYFEAYPDMKVGGATWDWLHAAIQSLETAQNPTNLQKIKVPVLTVVGTKDQVTPAHLIKPHLDLIPNSQTFIIEGARHDVLNEVDAYRNEAWRHIDSFLDKLAT